MPCAVAMDLNWMNVMRGIRAAPLGLKILAGRLPRAVPWADIGLARWAGTQEADMRFAHRGGTHRPHCGEANSAMGIWANPGGASYDVP